jgi:hypothetical protein
MTAANTTGTTAVCQPQAAGSAGLFIVLEGISGSGKSALGRPPAARLPARAWQTVPAPVRDLQPYVNANARPQLAFCRSGVPHALRPGPRQPPARARDR